VRDVYYFGCGGDISDYRFGDVHKQSFLHGWQHIFLFDCGIIISMSNYRTNATQS